MRKEESTRLNKRIEAILKQTPYISVRMLYERLSPDCTLGAFRSRVSVIKRRRND